MWQELPVEITGLKTGIIGLGVSGAMTAEALQYMGADISYYSRSRKPEYESKGMRYRDLPDLLQTCDVILTCLNKNVILLHEEEFRLMGCLLYTSFAGGSVSSVAMYEFTLWIITAAQWLLGSGLIPLVRVYMILVLASHISKEEIISNLTELLEQIIGWGLKTLIGVVLGFHVIQGLVLPLSLIHI